MRTDALQACDEMNGADVGGQKIVANFQWTDAYKRPPGPGEEELLTQAAVPPVGDYHSYERVPHRMHSRNHHHGRMPHGGGYPPAPHSGGGPPYQGHRGGYPPYHGMCFRILPVLSLFSFPLLFRLLFCFVFFLPIYLKSNRSHCLVWMGMMCVLNPPGGSGPHGYPSYGGGRGSGSGHHSSHHNHHPPRHGSPHHQHPHHPPPPHHGPPMSAYYPPHAYYAMPPPPPPPMGRDGPGGVGHPHGQSHHEVNGATYYGMPMYHPHAQGGHVAYSPPYMYASGPPGTPAQQQQQAHANAAAQQAHWAAQAYYGYQHQQQHMQHGQYPQQPPSASFVPAQQPNGNDAGSAVPPPIPVVAALSVPTIAAPAATPTAPTAAATSNSQPNGYVINCNSLSKLSSVHLFKYSITQRTSV
jgi:hypothetical protein